MRALAKLAVPGEDDRKVVVDNPLALVEHLLAVRAALVQGFAAAIESNARGNVCNTKALAEPWRACVS